MPNCHARLAGTFLPALLAFWSSVQAQTLNKNLLTNPGGEDGGAVTHHSDPKVAGIPGWTTTGGFSVGTYDSPDFLSSDSFGPASSDRGRQFFFAGTGSEESTASQTVDLTGAVAEIDAGIARYTLSGYIGWSGSSADGMERTALRVEFVDANGSSLRIAAAHGPDPSVDLHVDSGLLPRSITGRVPPGARQAKVTIDLGAPVNGDSGLAAENISVVLTRDPIFGVNLLNNADAELGGDQVLADGSSQGPVRGWNARTDFEAIRYSDLYKDYNKPDPAPAPAGAFLFACYYANGACSAYQTVDIANAAQLIDKGKVSYAASGWLGGDNTPDNVQINLTFMGASGNTIGSAQVGPVTIQDRGNHAGMLQRAAGGIVPAGTRLIRYALQYNRLRDDPEYAMGYADNLSLAIDAIQVTAVTNAASGLTGAVSPGEFVTIWGSGLGPKEAVNPMGLYKGTGGAKVFFNGIEAYTSLDSYGQINAVIPYQVGAKADVVVQYGGLESDGFPVSVTDSAPGIFTTQYGLGPAVVINGDRDKSINSSQNPAPKGTWVSFWATGQGLVDPQGQDGPMLDAPKKVRLPSKVTIGGLEATLYQDMPWLMYTGVVQMNVQIPNGIPSGDNELLLTIGSATSRKGVMLAVQ